MATTDHTLGEILGMRIEIERYVSAQDLELARMWGVAWGEVSDEFAAAAKELIDLGEGEWPSRRQVLRSQRALNAMKATAEALEDLTGRAGAQVTGSLRTILDSAEHWQSRIVRTQLPESGIRIGWARVDPDALDAIVRRSTRQIESRLRTLPARVQRDMKALLIRGVAVGENPNETARRIVARAQGEFLGGLRRARNIARTEFHDAHRAAARASRKANADVLAGWRWHCSLSARTCPSCLTQNGSLHPIDELGPHDHQQGRCTAVPVTKTWRELGIDQPEPTDRFPDARAWFGQQPAAVQTRIMGKERLAQFKAGHIGWGDLSQRVETPGWRPSYRIRPLGSTAGPLSPPPMPNAPTPKGPRPFDPSPIRNAKTITELGNEVQKMLGSRSIVKGFTEENKLNLDRMRSAAEVFAKMMHRFPQVKADFAVITETAGRAIARVKVGGRSLRTGEKLRDEMQLPRAKFSTRGRMGSAVQDAAREGWFHIHDIDGTDPVTYTISHEFGHLLDFQRPGGRLDILGIHKKVTDSLGMKPYSAEAARFLRNSKSGYGRTDLTEEIAEAFADVEVNGAHATDLSKAIHKALVGAYDEVK